MYKHCVGHLSYSRKRLPLRLALQTAIMDVHEQLFVKSVKSIPITATTLQVTLFFQKNYHLQIYLVININHYE